MLKISGRPLSKASSKVSKTNSASMLLDKRELDTLRLAGHIEFVGPSKTGTYRLVGA